MVVFDTTVLVALLQPDSGPPMGPNNSPVEKFRERLEHLVDVLTKNRTKIIIPAPAWGEFLVHADRAAEKYVLKIESSAVFQIAPFDKMCAVEVAAMTREAMDTGGSRGRANDTKAKIKYDRQIIAIARFLGAQTIYSDDKGMATFGKKIGLTVTSTAELPLPPEDSQISLGLGDSSPSVNENGSE